MSNGGDIKRRREENVGAVESGRCLDEWDANGVVGILVEENMEPKYSFMCSASS